MLCNLIRNTLVQNKVKCFKKARLHRFCFLLSFSNLCPSITAEIYDNIIYPCQAPNEYLSQMYRLCIHLI